MAPLNVATSMASQDCQVEPYQCSLLTRIGEGNCKFLVEDLVSVGPSALVCRLDPNKTYISPMLVSDRRTCSIVRAIIFARHPIHTLAAMFSFATQASLSLLSYLTLSGALLASANSTSCQENCSNRIFQYGQAGYSIENLAIRSNGKLLFTPPMPAAAVYQIDPTVGNSSFEVIASEDQLSGDLFALGIAELYPDVFAVISGDLNQTGTFTIHTINFNNGSAPVVNLTNAVDSATLLNGLAPLDQNSGVLLASDSYNARILRIDTTSGEFSVVGSGAVYQAVPGAMGAAASIGINGLRKLGDWLYFVNSSKKFLARIGIDTSGNLCGQAEILANLTGLQALPDDFALASDGTAYIAGSDEIVRVGQGAPDVLVGGMGNPTVAGDTSAQLGRGAQNQTLYVTSGVKPLNGVAQEPGFIVALDLQCLLACSES